MTSKITGYDAFRYYRSIYIHYDRPSFDVRKYGYNSSVASEKNYNREKAKYHYEKLASSFETRRGLCHYIGVCLYYNPGMYITELSDPERFDAIWKKYRKFMSAPEQNCKNDIQAAFRGLQSVSDVLKGSDSLLPLFADRISADDGTSCYTGIMMNRTHNWFDRVDESVGETHIIWESIRERLLKLEAFVFFKDDAKYMSIRDSIRDSIEDAKTLTNLNKPENNKDYENG